MPKKVSAGLLLYRVEDGTTKIFLVHPGGPFWARKDEGAWTIPKGEYEAGEDPLTAARREFQEETSFQVSGDFLPLGTLTQPSGKVLSVWAVEGDVDAAAIESNTFSLEWPPKSGRMQEFPEVDRALWCDLSTARIKMLAGQRPFLDHLQRVIRQPK